MKKYAIILFILTLIGIALTIVLFTKDEKLDQTVFLATTESIQNLQSLDKNLLVLLNQSRFNSSFDHDILEETNYQLSEEFSNLRYDALFEEIEASPGLSTAVKNFDNHYASREDDLSIYIETNQLISSALGSLSEASETILASKLESSESDVNRILGQVSTSIFGLTLSHKTIDKQSILDKVNALEVMMPTDSLESYESYSEVVSSILDNSEDAEQSFKSLTSLSTGPLLDAIEQEYVNYHNQAIGSSNQFSIALIIYGLLLLIALVFFANQIRRNYAEIRRNYLFLEQEVAERTDEIKTAYEDLQESQEQLIQSEKMASLGQMVAGVAHEINTPLGYVSSNVETLKLNIGDLSELNNELEVLLKTVTAKERNNSEVTQQLRRTLMLYKDIEAQELMSESTQLLEDGSYGLIEMSKLVSSLKDFARLDRQASEQVDIHDCIDSSVTIASNHIRENEVTVVKEFAELPNISCVPSKLNQLFLNIITNACQAMTDDGGQLTIKTTLQEESIKITFSDQGIGMDDETVMKMFDPFFTTKEIGVGTGLGMSIAYKIIDAHKGKIDVDSELGKGTSISITLPIN